MATPASDCGHGVRTSDELRDAASSVRTNEPTVSESMMIVVAGHLQVDPDNRASYLESCQDVIRLARTSRGCLDFALSPDLVDPGRINVFERWQAITDVEAFRGSGPSDEQASQILDADVRQFEVVAATSL